MRAAWVPLHDAALAQKFPTVDEIPKGFLVDPKDNPPTYVIDGKLVSTGPAIDSRECLGAVVSNGRIFYASQASGFVVSQTYGEASKKLPAVWERP